MFQYNFQNRVFKMLNLKSLFLKTHFFKQLIQRNSKSQFGRGAKVRFSLKSQNTVCLALCF
jgi:hypothetical protein